MNLIIIDYDKGKITVKINDYEIVYPTKLYEIKTDEHNHIISHKHNYNYSPSVVSYFPTNDFSVINLVDIDKHNLYTKPKKESKERYV